MGRCVHFDRAILIQLYSVNYSSINQGSMSLANEVNRVSVDPLTTAVARAQRLANMELALQTYFQTELENKFAVIFNEFEELRKNDTNSKNFASFFIKYEADISKALKLAAARRR